MKQAKINCPHCDKPITVRMLDASDKAEVSKAVGDMFTTVDKSLVTVFKAMDDTFKKMFK